MSRRKLDGAGVFRHGLNMGGVGLVSVGETGGKAVIGRMMPLKPRDRESRDADRLLGPVHNSRLCDFVIDREGLARGVRIGRIDTGYLPAEAVREREKLSEVLPFVFG